MQAAQQERRHGDKKQNQQRRDGVEDRGDNRRQGYIAAVLSNEFIDHLRALAVHDDVYCHHITMAFMPDEATYRKYAPLIGKRIEFDTVAMHTDEQGQAMSVYGVKSENPHPHITISCTKGTQPKYSNDLVVRKVGEPLTLHGSAMIQWVSFAERDDNRRDGGNVQAQRKHDDRHGQQKRPQQKPTYNGRLELAGVETVLMKWNFTNPSHLPQDAKGRSLLPERTRLPSEALDSIHANEASNEALAEVGRLREGRVDTGSCVISNFPGVQAALLRDDLRAAGFGLQHAHWFYLDKSGEGRHDKVVVEIAFARKSRDMMIPKETKRAIDRLIVDATWFCYVYRNPNGVGTVNFVGRQPDTKVQNHLLVIDGAVTCVENR